MLDDPRIKRVIKRYKKDEEGADSSLDVSLFGDGYLLSALRGEGEESLSRPHELDDEARAYLSKAMGNVFEPEQFDYFLQSYVREEFVAEYRADPTTCSNPAPETGPPAKIPITAGMRWRPVRPKDGKEQWAEWRFKEDDKQT
jgi:hypothetical protein